MTGDEWRRRDTEVAALRRTERLVEKRLRELVVQLDDAGARAEAHRLVALWPRVWRQLRQQAVRDEDRLLLLRLEIEDAIEGEDFEAEDELEEELEELEAFVGGMERVAREGRWGNVLNERVPVTFLQMEAA